MASFHSRPTAEPRPMVRKIFLSPQFCFHGPPTFLTSISSLHPIFYIISPPHPIFYIISPPHPIFCIISPPHPSSISSLLPIHLLYHLSSPSHLLYHLTPPHPILSVPIPLIYSSPSQCFSSTADTDGMVKVLSDAKTDRLLGVHIIGSVSLPITSLACILSVHLGHDLRGPSFFMLTVTLFPSKVTYQLTN